MGVRSLLIFILLCSTFRTYAQEENLRRSSLLFYGDVYYSLPVNSTGRLNELRFVNHTESRQVAINSFIANYTFETEKMRVNAGLIAGSYAKENYIGEPFEYRNIYQANIGLRLSQKHNIWVDAGILPSHIGMETVIAADNPTIYRSMAAEFSPYYEAGLKISAQQGKHFVALLLLNGWQRIKLRNPTSLPSFGGQYTYTTSKFSFNWSSFLGNLEDKSYYDFLFNNFYASVGNEKWKLFIGADLGLGKLPDTTNAEVLYTTYGILEHAINRKNKVAIRAEYYNDPSRLIAMPLAFFESLNCIGTSFTYSYNVLEVCMVRAEYRFLSNATDVFLLDGWNGSNPTLSKSKHMVCLSLSYKLQNTFR